MIESTKIVAETNWVYWYLNCEKNDLPVWPLLLFDTCFLDSRSSQDWTTCLIFLERINHMFYLTVQMHFDIVMIVVPESLDRQMKPMSFVAALDDMAMHQYLQLPFLLAKASIPSCCFHMKCSTLRTTHLHIGLARWRAATHCPEMRSTGTRAGTRRELRVDGSVAILSTPQIGQF